MTLAQIGNPFNGHSDREKGVSISSDGLRIVSGSRDKTVRLWSAETHRKIGDPFERHADEVFLVSESSDGMFVVSNGAIM